VLANAPEETEENEGLALENADFVGWHSYRAEECAKMMSAYRWPV